MRGNVAKSPCKTYHQPLAGKQRHKNATFLFFFLFCFLHLKYVGRPLGKKPLEMIIQFNLALFVAWSLLSLSVSCCLFKKKMHLWRIFSTSGNLFRLKSVLDTSFFFFSFDLVARNISTKNRQYSLFQRVYVIEIELNRISYFNKNSSIIINKDYFQ